MALESSPAPASTALPTRPMMARPMTMATGRCTLNGSTDVVGAVDAEQHDHEQEQHHDGAGVDDHLHDGQEVGLLGYEEHRDARTASAPGSARRAQGWGRRMTPRAPPSTMIAAATKTASSISGGLPRRDRRRLRVPACSTLASSTSSGSGVPVRASLPAWSGSGAGGRSPARPTRRAHPRPRPPPRRSRPHPPRGQGSSPSRQSSHGSCWGLPSSPTTSSVLV